MCVPFVFLYKHQNLCFIDVIEINSLLIVTHNKSGHEIIPWLTPVKLSSQTYFARTQPVFGWTNVFHLGLSDCTLQ